MLFLSDTYEGVLMLTPLLVAVEVLIRLLWPQEAATTANTNKEGTKENKDSELALTVLLDKDGEALEMEPLKEGTNNGMFLKFWKAVGFLSCLILWGMSGTYAESSWRQDQPVVRECLDMGGSLSACLPCLLTSSSPVRGQLSWVLVGILLLLGLTRSLAFLLPKQLSLLIFHRNQLHMSRERWSTSGLHLRTLYKWFEVHRSRKCREEKWKFATLSQLRTLDYNSSVDSEKIPNSCWAQSSQFGHNAQQWPLGNPVPLSGLTGLAHSCKLHVLVSQPQTEHPPKGAKQEESTGQAQHPHKRLLWKPQKESPCLRGDLMTGLVCGLLLCAFPTVLSTNVLLIRNLDNLAVYAVKHLLIPAQSK